MSRPRLPVGDELAVAYLDWCEGEHVSANTVRRRRTVLRSVGNPGTATREEIEAWWASRRDRCDVTRANDLAMLRAFYKWCAVWEHRLDDPTVRLSAPKLASGAPAPFTRAEFEQILAHVAERPELRRAVLLGAWAGLRRAEAAGLMWADVDVDAGRARVAGKGRKTRVVPFAPRLIEELLPDTGGNVVTGRVEAWSPDHFGRVLNSAIAAAGVRGTFHKLRHRYGTIAYQRTKDPKAIAALMGHSSASTTMTFYAAAADDAAQAIAAAVIGD